MKLTIYPGTFNPVHIAHLIIAETVHTYLGLEKIIFIPSSNPPHRNNDIAEAKARMEMVKLAISDNQCFEASDIELRMDGKSYSYNTVRRLYEEYSNIEGKINFIIGADAFELIDTWYEAQKLAEIVNFVVLARPDYPKLSDIQNKINIKNYSYTEIPIPVMAVSSSYIRNRIKAGQSIKYLVSSNVEEYIIKNRVYI